ncbi:MAG: hypothetical protein K9H64_02005 [Bacteroidales bacterium]|nr:hypothetical protein [Bacteroidales bacterium]MCF8454680.1 hypothetical protein [Bacteroidales bacterium]
MKAIEFETTIKHGLIHIPPRYKSLKNTHAKVIVMVKENKADGNYDKTLFSEMIGKANKIGLFSEMIDSVSWQKQQRNKWE